MTTLKWIFFRLLSIALYVAAFGCESQGALNVLTGLIVASFVIATLTAFSKDEPKKRPRSVPLWLNTASMFFDFALLLWFGHPWLAAMDLYSTLLASALLFETPAKEAA
jgi:hypothetical protein